MLEQYYNYNNFEDIEISAKLWTVAIYVRLSREDYGIGQSESIDNQIKFLTEYIKNRGWNLIKIYSDDGYTGTNFDRPSFKNMIQDIEIRINKSCNNKRFIKTGQRPY